MRNYRQKDASQTAVLPAFHPHFQILFPTHLLPILVTPTSLGLLWKSDRPIAESSTGQNTTLTRGRHPCPRRDSNSQSQQVSGIRPCFRQQVSVIRPWFRQQVSGIRPCFRQQASGIRPCFRQRGHAVCYLRLMYTLNFGLNCLMF
jgi:hypothetical protein